MKRKKPCQRKRYVPYVINKRKKLITYNIDPESPQYKFIQKIYIHGFDCLPKGFNARGWGVSAPVFYLYRKLNQSLGKYEVHILRQAEPKIETFTSKVRIYFEYESFIDCMNHLKEYRHERNSKSNNLVDFLLYSQFPKRFAKPSTNVNLEYKKDTIANILAKKNIVSKLSNIDINKLIDFYPKLLKDRNLKIQVRKRLDLSQKSKNAGESIYLENIISEYEKKLRAANQNENNWQKFLKQHILLFNTNYIGLIEKQNISLSGDYPDFMLISVYGYLDVYEIKRPNTKLLSYDSSRQNYYWSVDMAKAISQVENYIELLQTNKDPFISHMKRDNNIEISVMKPKGYIISGESSQLINNKMKEDFHLLNGALKNVEVILYDEYLVSLKNLLKRLQS